MSGGARRRPQASPASGRGTERNVSTAEPIRVLLADDHPIMRSGLRDALQAEGDITVVGAASDGVEAVRLARELEPQVVLMDVLMPNQDGIDACREIAELLPETQVLMLTASEADEAVLNSLAAGAAGFLRKVDGPEELAEAVRAVAEGRMSIPDDSVRQVINLIRGRRRARELPGPLSERQRAYLKMFALGHSYAEIAEAHGIKPVSVRNAMHRIQDRLGLGSKQELVIWAARQGLLDESQPGLSLPSPRTKDLNR